MVERGLQPTLSYIEKKGEGNLSILRIESTQLRGVQLVFDIHPYFGVAQSIRASWDCFVDEVWTFAW
jgi:hypothetical protein